MFRRDDDAGGIAERRPALVDAPGIDADDDGFVVDVSLVSALLGVRASDVQSLMRDGRITSLCEEGVDEHRDQFRLTFFHGNRRACVSVDRSGRILGRSIIDFGTRASARAIHSRAPKKA